MDAKIFNIVDSFLQGFPATKNDIFQPADAGGNRGDKQKRAICEKDANSSYENSDTVFARAKLGYCSMEIIA